MSKTLLIVHHTPSPHCQEMFEAVVSGATEPEIEGVEVVRRPALAVSPTDMLDADSYLLGSPANLGYMSGTLKHYFGEYRLSTVGAALMTPFLFRLLGRRNTGRFSVAIW
jgi:multimeric flavodoxin WrbA